MTDADKAIDQSGLTPEDKASIKRLLTLTAKHARDLTGPELREAREAAGLTKQQAQRVLDVSWTTLTVCEEFGTCGVERIESAMDAAYGLGRGK